MAYPDITLGSDQFISAGDNSQWPNTESLLRLIQRDYQGARRQLEQINRQLAESEALVNQHLQYAFLSSRSYRTLCLTGHKSGAAANQMGSTVLGAVARPTKVPDFSKIEVRCLGRFEVRSAFGQVGHWQSVKARSVFQYLLVRPRQPTVKASSDGCFVA